MRRATDELPIGGRGPASTAWWGMMCLIATEGILFVYLIFSYAYLGVQAASWPPDGAPSLALALPNTFLLIASSVVLEIGTRRYRAGKYTSPVPTVLITAVMGIAFIAVQLQEWGNKSFSVTDGSYGSIYFTLTGIHLAHVAMGVVALLALAWWGWEGRLERGGQHLSLGRLYWHFIDAVWLVIFLSLYLVPQQP